MGRYLARRLLAMIPVVIIVTMISFALLYLLPGDTALAILGDEAGRNPEAYRAIRRELGLDDPIYVQYGRWAINLAQGDLGTSVRSKEPIAAVITARLPVTLQLGFMAILLALTIALPVAVVSAIRPGSKLDIVGTLSAMCGIAMPSFWFGILLIYVLAFVLRLLPPSGYTPPQADLAGNLKQMLMPATVMGMQLAAVTMRQARAALIEVMQEDYITTARAKGLRERLVVSRHALKNAFIPVVTIVGLQIGHIFGGAVVTETIFALPGIGRLVVDSIFFRDYPVVQAVVLVLAFGVLLSNLVTDLVYAYLDPRIRYS